MEEKKLKILVVDDNVENSITFVKNVSRVLPGMEVITALNGEQGVKLAKTHEPDVILIDVSVSKTDALKISQIIKTEKSLQSTPMIFITDLENDKEFRLEALKAGAEAFLIKQSMIRY